MAAGLLVGGAIGVLAQWQDVRVALDFSRGDGLGVQSGLGVEMEVKGPTSSIVGPDLSPTSTFVVGWGSPAEPGSELAHFVVRYAPTAFPAAADWLSWVDWAPADEGAAATFQGEPGVSYSFRSQGCDAQDNCGLWSADISVKVAGTADGENEAPVVSLLQPSDGAALEGVVSIRWDRFDLGADTPPVVNLKMRSEGTEDWVPLYSGKGNRFDLGTNGWADGAYEVVAVATDGTRSGADSVLVDFVNGVTEIAGLGEVTDGVLDDASSGGEDGRGGDSKGGPAPGALVAIGALGLALLANFRFRRRT